MNYFNPYFGYPSMTIPASSGGIFSRLFGKGINWSSILSGTQKTLGIINQAIPVVKQMSPVMKNAKTMFRIMNEFKKVDTPNDNQNKYNSNHTQSSREMDNEMEENTTSTSSHNNGPTFFI